MTLPGVAAWRHVDAREGFEVVFVHSEPKGGVRFAGTTTAVERGAAWTVRYEIDVDPGWTTLRAWVERRDEAGTATVELLRDPGDDTWTVNGDPEPDLTGCLDVDLEASVLTNAFPLRRAPLEPGAEADAPAAYVRVDDLGVGVLEQRYERLADGGEWARYAYASPGFTAELAYDAAGLVVDYPGLATRVG